ncbi:acyltransferase [Fulvitalea axinellae]|uniref:Acyltransferase n=1 Tax=Fulvitalea axinellae TaxID=1182444 RepID=A0AAU9D5G4_9BACT|nr:acyltransferase [Fulvitalea axinellae]
MIDINDFEEIRPYRDHEAYDVIQELLKHEEFIQTVDAFLGDDQKEYVNKMLPQATTIKEFQTYVIAYALANIIHTTTDGFTVENSERALDGDKHLFISNHRDIVLDSGLLNFFLNEAEADTCEIAIGSNLLENPLVRDVVKLNKSFMVTRGVSARELLMHSKRLSNYIRHQITSGNSSVWLAQREGRAKDGNDTTQSSVLKMVNLSGGKDLRKNFMDLNVLPFGISYEFIPCAGLKAKETAMKAINKEYVKGEHEDIISMRQGILGEKGRVHISFGRHIVDFIDEVVTDEGPNRFYDTLIEAIDREIHANLRLWPSNYIALDMVNGDKAHADKYTDEDVSRFEKYLNEQVADSGMERDEILPHILLLFSNPAVNHLKAVAKK